MSDSDPLPFSARAAKYRRLAEQATTQATKKMLLDLARRHERVVKETGVDRDILGSSQEKNA